MPWNRTQQHFRRFRLAHGTAFAVVECSVLNQCEQHCAASGVRILIGGYVTTLSDCFLDHLKRLSDHAPVRFTYRFVVRNLYSSPARFTDVQGFPNRIKKSRSLVPHMRNVKPAVLTNHLRQCDDFFSTGVPSRFVDQTGRQSDRPSLHAFGHVRQHSRQFRVAGRAIGNSTHRLSARCVMSD